MPGDTWIGNACVIDHDHAAVVYAPRTFTNHPDMMLGEPSPRSSISTKEW
ncbi:hypothetical protein N7U49_47800 (plasmid) [Streptomyces sp. AD2-2]|nr:hypothetical protein N7U49_47800 [Streptomyces sp. AD2-2]